MVSENSFSEEENNCIKHEFVFPELSKNILKKIKFDISNEDLIRISSVIKEEYGTTVYLNKSFDLKLQYHGRFRSFLFSLDLHKDTLHQCTLNLLRIETHTERTHNDGKMAFLGPKKLSGPHLHWYNSFFKIFLNQGIFKLNEPNIDIYHKIIEIFIDNNKELNFNAQLIKKAVPYSQFLELCNLVISKKMKFREDGYITKDDNIKMDPIIVLQQIINREIT